MSHPDDPDYTLLERIRHGDHIAFQKLYERHGHSLLNFVIQILQNRQQSEDVLQEIMLIVWSKADHFRPIGDVRGWLFGIAKRQAFKALRKNRPHLSLRDEHLNPENNPSDHITRHLALKEAILQLPSVEQQALEMVYYRGMTLEEVAAALHIPVNTVKTRLFRARQRLRIYLEEDINHHAR